MNNEEDLFQNQFGKNEATASLTALTDTLTEAYNYLPEQLQDATDGLLAGLMEG